MITIGTAKTMILESKEENTLRYEYIFCEESPYSLIDIGVEENTDKNIENVIAKNTAYKGMNLFRLKIKYFFIIYFPPLPSTFQYGLILQNQS